MPHNSKQPLPPDVAATVEAFAGQVAARFPRRYAAEIKLEAAAAAFNWVFDGPLRAGGAPVFSDWQPKVAIFALQRRARIGADGRIMVEAPASLSRHVRPACARALCRLSQPKPCRAFTPETFASYVERVDVRLTRTRKFCCRHRHPRRCGSFAEALEAFGQQVAYLLRRRACADLRASVAAAVSGWVMHGPLRADGSPRFCRWNADSAVFAFCRLRRVLPHLRHRAFPLPNGGTVAFRERRHFHAPRSLWLRALALCRPVVRKPEAGSARDEIGNNVPDRTEAKPSAWDTLARSFVEHVADARARLTATWGNARHRAALARAALDAVRSWVAVRSKRLNAASLLAVLFRRTERAKAAEVHIFAYWPASLLRVVRRALDLVAVVRVEIAQTVRATA